MYTYIYIYICIYIFDEPPRYKRGLDLSIVEHQTPNPKSQNLDPNPWTLEPRPHILDPRPETRNTKWGLMAPHNEGHRVRFKRTPYCAPLKPRDSLEIPHSKPQETNSHIFGLMRETITYMRQILCKMVLESSPQNWGNTTTHETHELTVLLGKLTF